MVTEEGPLEGDYYIMRAETLWMGLLMIENTLESCLVSSVMQENSEKTPILSKDSRTYHPSSLHTL